MFATRYAPTLSPSALAYTSRSLPIELFSSRIELMHLTVSFPTECYEPPTAGPSPTSPASTCGPLKSPPVSHDTIPGSESWSSPSLPVSKVTIANTPSPIARPGDMPDPTPAGNASRAVSPAWALRLLPLPATAATNTSSSRMSTTTARRTTKPEMLYEERAREIRESGRKCMGKEAGERLRVHIYRASKGYLGLRIWVNQNRNWTKELRTVMQSGCVPDANV